MLGLVNPSDPKSGGNKVVGRTSIRSTPQAFSAIMVRLWGRESLVVPRRYAGATGLSTHPMVYRLEGEKDVGRTSILSSPKRFLRSQDICGAGSR